MKLIIIISLVITILLTLTSMIVALESKKIPRFNMFLFALSMLLLIIVPWSFRTVKENKVAVVIDKFNNKVVDHKGSGNYYQS